MILIVYGNQNSPTHKNIVESWLSEVEWQGKWGDVGQKVQIFKINKFWRSNVQDGHFS